MSDPDFKVTSSWTGGGPLTNAKVGGSPKQTGAATIPHAGPALLVRVVALGLGLLGALGWALGRVPEFLSVDFLRDLWEAVVGVSPVVPVGPGAYAIDRTLVLAGVVSAVLAAVAYTTVRQAATVVLPLAGLVAVTLVWNALPMLDDPSDDVPALVLTAVGIGATVRGALQLGRTLAPGKRTLSWRPAQLLSLTLCVPWALGRLIAGIPVETSRGVPLGELLTIREFWWTVATGVAALFAANAALLLIPPYTGRSIRNPVLLLVVLVLAVFAFLVPRAGV